jgi:hypothetical protein
MTSLKLVRHHRWLTRCHVIRKGDGAIALSVPNAPRWKERLIIDAVLAWAAESGQHRTAFDRWCESVSHFDPCACDLCQPVARQIA